MRVLRRRSTLGFLALLAVALQAMLAFAHTHTHAPTVSRAQGLAARAITYGMCRADSESPCPEPARRHDHANCPTCWSINFAGAAVLEAPATLATRLPPAPLPAPVPKAALPDGAASVHFQARAPPARA